MQLEIRLMQPEETDAARRVIYAVAGSIFNPEMDSESLYSMMRQDWPLDDLDANPNPYAPPDGQFLLALDAGRIIGTGGVRRLDDATAELKRLWLLPTYQGQKIGYALMQRLLAFSRQRGYRRMVLTTSIYQERALAFYQQLGFAPIPMFHDHSFESERALGMDFSD